MMRNGHDETRTLILVDVENLSGGTDFTAADVTDLRHRVEVTVGCTAGTQAVIATSCGAPLIEAGLGWPGARCIWMRGHDGADLALADVALNENVPGRYKRVVICSGDGLFAVAARHLVNMGVHVTVVSTAGSLSRHLARVADEVHLLDNALGRAA